MEKGETGYLVPSADLESLVERVDTLLKDAGLRNRMGAAGRAKVESDFDTRKESERLAHIFRKTLSDRLA